jgi:hypothetical protein
MKLFDFFKKKPSGDNTPAAQPIDSNTYLLETLQNNLVRGGYRVERHPQYLSLIVNDNLELATAILENPDNHPSVFHIMVMAIHPVCFPQGLEEYVVGIGSTLQEKVKVVLDDYLESTFLTILESLSDTHDPALDFMAQTGDKDILWHPSLSSLTLRGPWKEYPDIDLVWRLLLEQLKGSLRDQKMNWLMVFIAKQADGRVVCECLLNNEPWHEGTTIFNAYAQNWPATGEYRSLKQFIILRRCDAFDV